MPITEQFLTNAGAEIIWELRAHRNILAKMRIASLLSEPRHQDPHDLALWQQMNDDFNQKIALRFGAPPLLNQTKRLSGAIVQSALGDDWTNFVGLRARFDGRGRFLTDYFAQLGA